MHRLPSPHLPAAAFPGPPMTVTWSRAKEWLIGSPIASAEHEHQLLPKVLALPVFASDCLSSVAYATEEIVLVLALAGDRRLRPRSSRSRWPSPP